MKVVIQRVSRAKISVGGHEVNSITKGLCLLVGLQKTDKKKDIDDMVQKILKLRLFDQDEKKWHCNVMDMSYEILSISQFTLCYKLKGNKLDFHMAMPGNLAMQNYQYFLETLRTNYNPSKIKDGAFGEMMEVEIVNDGPVTVQLEFPNPEKCLAGKSDKLGDVDEL
ncbi:D-tyrosyl-tRNA(Tyr) deacylase 1 [Acyrthosiphon pisum]|uniref:D-aminoacyl-tRNA deacylase n=1 Tax=Acyrthosiphon pisum TaxID=7029 RepID=C4WXW5_ACYPI|nr:D-tyrosyl-tRNA(Tyr) deacylase 1 [Acyrthosiphon pisum]BAH72735.1 ACYPI006782 [Acyrthosiphon pisum]|eukprot:NP_001156226.1 D-tyrosyl-tRNA(Tyr) deacylase 1 [Acyrthosiphon pisum]